jgi:hypothetical protein
MVGLPEIIPVRGFNVNPVGSGLSIAKLLAVLMKDGTNGVIVVF